MKKVFSLTDTKVWWIFLVLAGVIYSNTFRSAFVFDDFAATGNQAVRHLSDLPALWHAFNTRFVVGVSLALNYALGQDNVVGYHLCNTFIHILNAFLVYKLVCLMPKTSKLLGFLTALIFLTHPLQTQGVTYIWQRATSLATFFYLGALVFYIRGRLKASLRSYVGCLLFAVLGMFTKEIVFTLPFAIALYEVIFLREIPLKTKQKMALWIPLALSLLIIPLAMTQADGRTLGLVKPQDGHFTRTIKADKMSRHDFTLTEMNVLRTYLRLFVLPIRQSADYDYPKARSLAEPNTLFSLFLLVALFASAVLFLKKRPLLAFGIFLFFLTVSLEALVVQENFIFEHRLYLPMVGLSLFFVISLSYWLKTPRQLTLVVIGIVGCLSILTYQRNFVWRDDVALWDDVVQRFPNNARAFNNRGYAYQKKDLVDLALVDYDRALELKPGYTDAYANRSSVYGIKKQFDKAKMDIDKAIALDPGYAIAYSNRGAVHASLGQLDEALLNFNKAIQLTPDCAEFYSNRGTIYMRMGNLDSALQDFNLSIALKPNQKTAYDSRATLLFIKAQSAQLQDLVKSQGFGSDRQGAK